MAAGTPYLMYHELILDGRPLCRPDEGYARYCIPLETFRAQLHWLRANGFRGWSVSDALEGGATDRPGVAITFDDGCETDLLAAAPALHDAGFGATFFVVSTWIGRKGYLSSSQLRALHDGGFEIGAHSRTHAYLSDLAPDALREEVARSKVEIEQMLGAPVAHFSCPGGRWSPAVERAARDAGFRSVSTSRIGQVTDRTPRFELPRIAIRDGMSLPDFQATCRGDSQWLARARGQLLDGAKRLMGNTLYERVRGAVLRPGPATSHLPAD